MRIPLPFNGYFIIAFPIERKGRLLHITFNFGTNYPLHFIPAYHLPVYASQHTLPYTTQDSVQDCWLSIILTTISNRMYFLNFQGATLTPLYVSVYGGSKVYEII